MEPQQQTSDTMQAFMQSIDDTPIAFHNSQAAWTHPGQYEAFIMEDHTIRRTEEWLEKWTEVWKTAVKIGKTTRRKIMSIPSLYPSSAYDSSRGKALSKYSLPQVFVAFKSPWVDDWTDDSIIRMSQPTTSEMWLHIQHLNFILLQNLCLRLLFLYSGS